MADLETCYAWVVDEPTLDEPREAFAVAVERTDPDRAEFIRVQLAMARARAAWADSYPLSLRSAALTERHHQRWAQPVRQLVAGYQFLRGFVDLVTMDAGIFLAFSADLYRRAPVLHLDLTGVRDVAGELFDDPQLERIVSLSLRGCALGDHGVALLARSPYLRRLEWLDLSDNGIGEEGLDALAASTSLPRLGYVGLADNAIDDPTPAHADEYDATSEVGRALQDRYGPRDWLEAQARWRWPPDRDAVRRPARVVTRSRAADGQDGRMDLHPYDGKKRRFRHDDAGDQAFARGEVERLLRMPIGAHSLRYDLAFYSGGIGIVDNLFISIEAADAWRAKVPDGFLLAEDALEGDIRWLIMADDDLTPDAALTTFIADHRAPFQAPTREEMWIERGSDVNSWTVAYTYQGWLHWMSHDEG